VGRGLKSWGRMIRVLIVDDYEDWRRTVRELIQRLPELQVIGEVSDGLQAVQKAEELKPDLVVLDIGLPKLNGIEAARQIRQLSPSSKIIVLSQDNSVEVVESALNTGAHGYVHKARAVSDLLPAMDAVLQGKQFVSDMSKGYEFTDTPRAKNSPRHEVQFYSDDAILIESFTRFIAAALKIGNPAIVMATKSHLDSLLQKLKTEPVDIDGAIQRGIYIPLDAADALSSIMVNDLPDTTRFFENVSGLIEAASKVAKANHSRVAYCGERVGLLWVEGKTDAAMRLEQLCSELGKLHDVDILCAYPLSSFQGKEDEHPFKSICAEHSAVYSQ
jgi:DNA-binding NarL/FixJ family response regulator